MPGRAVPRGRRSHGEELLSNVETPDDLATALEELVEMEAASLSRSAGPKPPRG